MDRHTFFWEMAYAISLFFTGGPGVPWFRTAKWQAVTITVEGTSKVF